MSAEKHASPPVALTVAGSDNCAGAGIQADLKTFSAHGVYGLTAITTVVAEVPGLVKSVAPIDESVVRDQIELSLRSYPVVAAKTGMLWSAAIITLTAELLRPYARRGGGTVWVVVDPVMVATSGDRLLQPEAVAAYQERLFPLADLITPNLDETAVLLGRNIASRADLIAAGRELSRRYGAAFLMKGGHLREEEAVDYLVTPEGEIQELSAPFAAGISTHGTGCTYSAAIAARLAAGSSLAEAARLAKTYITGAITRSHVWGSVAGLNHFAGE